MTDLNARLDTISESLEIATRDSLITDTGYLAWRDAIGDILDATPKLVAALRAVLALHKPDDAPRYEGWCNHCAYSWPCATYTAIAAALVSA